MEKSKIVFLCLILLLVLIVSNYVSVDEGFAAKKSAPTTKPVATTKPPTKPPTTKPPTRPPTTKPVATKKPGSLKQRADKIENIAKNTEKMIRENEALNKKVLEKASALDNSVKQISNTASKLDSDMARINKIAETTEKNTNNAMTQISEKAATIDKSVNANKTIQSEIEAKVGGVGKQLETIKNHTDTVMQIKKDVDNTMSDFQTNSATMLKTIQLAIDKFNSTQLPKQGFQNMDNSYVMASDALKKDYEKAKSLAFTTIDSAYDGTMRLEGFGTATDSAYLNSSDLFNLEREVVTALNDFSEKYIDYQKCLQTKRYNVEQKLSVADCSTKLSTVMTAKETLIGKINTLNTAIGDMGKKTASTLTPYGAGATDGPGKKITETEFQKRHAAIKQISENIRNVRSDLDAKMAQLLDKNNGPLPEAQTKHNFENYATIGWSVLATSILYYTFVKME